MKANLISTMDIFSNPGFVSFLSECSPDQINPFITPSHVFLKSLLGSTFSAASLSFSISVFLPGWEKEKKKKHEEMCPVFYRGVFSRICVMAYVRSRQVPHQRLERGVRVLRFKGFQLSGGREDFGPRTVRSPKYIQNI